MSDSEYSNIEKLGTAALVNLETFEPVSKFKSEGLADRNKTV
jgi:hypothetical protein